MIATGMNAQDAMATGLFMKSITSGNNTSNSSVLSAKEMVKPVEMKQMMTSHKFSDQYFADRGFKQDGKRWIHVNDHYGTPDCTVRLSGSGRSAIAILCFGDVKDDDVFPYDIYDEAWLDELLYAIYRIKPKVKNANS